MFDTLDCLDITYNIGRVDNCIYLGLVVEFMSYNNCQFISEKELGPLSSNQFLVSKIFVSKIFGEINSSLHSNVESGHNIPAPYMYSIREHLTKFTNDITNSQIQLVFTSVSMHVLRDRVCQLDV